MNWAKKHKILTVIIVIVLLAIIGGASGSKKTDTSKSASPAKSESKKAETAKLNTPVRDGKFEFTVTAIKCGVPTVGTSQYLTKTAQGQYCLLSLSVKNIGNEAQSLFSTNQKLLNAQGQKFSADDVATSYAAPQGSTWYSNINPGNSVTGDVVFDLPKDQTPTKAELHDSAYSGGAKVSLQ